MMITPVYLPTDWRVSESEFMSLVQANPDLRLELTATGEVIAMPPTGSETSGNNIDLAGYVWLWNKQTKLGKVFDSSGGFRLPNGAIRSPDVAWIRLERWQSLSSDERQGFAPLCPDFVLELLSPSDHLITVQNKMQEYLDNGCQLGWLINSATRTTEIYRPQQNVVTIPFDQTLLGEEILPGFALNLQTLFF
ncbi:Uma2 family endonuclease [Gloeomargarita lithophora]|nr:Uma2 family endonuclease [Gloeomargarita lithophora]